MPSPMVQVPLFRRAGEGEGGLVLGPASKRPEVGGTVRYAATDTVRVGGSVSGASGPDVSHNGGRIDARDQSPRLFADGFVGAEGGGLVFRFGALAGAGYGQRSPISSCRASASGEPVCMQTARDVQHSDFVRSYGQLHVAFAPPGPLAVSLAIRVPVIVELPRADTHRTTELGTELALTQTLRFRFLRLDLQPMWSHQRGFSFHLALLLRFDASSARAGI